MTVEYSWDMGGADRELDRLAGGPDHRTIMRLESVLLTFFAQTQAAVHVMTGALRASGHPESDFDGERWTGTHIYDRYPGIYELGRGMRPTRNHPEGMHYFFWPDDASPPFYEAIIMDWLEGR